MSKIISRTSQFAATTARNLFAKNAFLIIYVKVLFAMIGPAVKNVMRENVVDVSLNSVSSVLTLRAVIIVEMDSVEKLTDFPVALEVIAMNAIGIFATIAILFIVATTATSQAAPIALSTQRVMFYNADAIIKSSVQNVLHDAKIVIPCVKIVLHVLRNTWMVACGDDIYISCKIDLVLSPEFYTTWQQVSTYLLSLDQLMLSDDG